MPAAAAKRQTRSPAASTKKYKRCRHCLKHLAKRPRGLCWKCHRVLSIRRLYPAKTNQYGHPRTPNWKHSWGEAPAPKKPTLGLPGSDEKIAAMAARAARKQSLWCRQDAEEDLR